MLCADWETKRLASSSLRKPSVHSLHIRARVSNEDETRSFRLPCNHAWPLIIGIIPISVSTDLSLDRTRLRHTAVLFYQELGAITSLLAYILTADKAGKWVSSLRTVGTNRPMVPQWLQKYALSFSLPSVFRESFDRFPLYFRYTPPLPVFLTRAHVYTEVLHIHLHPSHTIVHWPLALEDTRIPSWDTPVLQGFCILPSFPNRHGV